MTSLTERERERVAEQREGECVICVDVASFSLSLSALECSILLQLSFSLQPRARPSINSLFLHKERQRILLGGLLTGLSLSLFLTHISQDRPGNSFLMFFQITLILTLSATAVLPLPAFNYRWQYSQYTQYSQYNSYSVFHRHTHTPDTKVNRPFTLL